MGESWVVGGWWVAMVDEWVGGKVGGKVAGGKVAGGRWCVGSGGRLVGGRWLVVGLWFGGW